MWSKKNGTYLIIVWVMHFWCYSLHLKFLRSYCKKKTPLFKKAHLERPKLYFPPQHAMYVLFSVFPGRSYVCLQSPGNRHHLMNCLERLWIACQLFLEKSLIPRKKPQSFCPFFESLYTLLRFKAVLSTCMYMWHDYKNVASMIQKQILDLTLFSCPSRKKGDV